MGTIDCAAKPRLAIVRHHDAVATGLDHHEQNPDLAVIAEVRRTRLAEAVWGAAVTVPVDGNASDDRQHRSVAVEHALLSDKLRGQMR
ncbi:hypothetical protein [Nocardia pseudovaccinii]|uniref:hypothetical protein n=1 Tax=Nocardia pseudovaccinii TaxID=189540 RepID=UPI000A6B0571|nr:hypothetical protein [Nocardia pseudovaccinii]